ncbi:DUF4200 domain-containing protein [Blastococcus sp. CCUG 61487]|uniref:DUF4200 domain-containing protein n=1 Tax=Blastococcus sp. CCUG 61487 TaxID=1840703 RepID=UPI0010BFFCA9|nr:DUF4200 domain-containing protein [Blastococcus sp. CCUG 61487]TKJ25248.1 hypothetical protein A6V29_04290 [Blastococcus sp. CCUG 61487]
MTAQRGEPAQGDYETPPLDPAKVDAHIADVQQRIETTREAAERLTSLADDEWREVYRMEAQLREFRAAVNRVGLTDGSTR